MKAVVLLSGGFDSAALALYARHKLKYESVSGLFVECGQPALDQERDAVMRLRSVAQLDMLCIQRGPLLTPNGDGYIPARNLVLCSIAASYAEANEIQHVLIGVVMASAGTDFGTLPDTTSGFVAAMSAAARASTKTGVSVRAPLSGWTKKQIRAWLKLRNLHGKIAKATWSCRRDSVRPCGECISCIDRSQGMVDA